jgi:hypothetical protein
MSQKGKFYAGIIGFPIRVELQDEEGEALIPSQITIDEINTVELVVVRPNGKSFSRTLTPPDCIVGRGRSATRRRLSVRSYSPDDE